ncbi:MAG: PaaX family transcriptional regulator C-terminal domain-containing protein [Marmoricola sp.]
MHARSALFDLYGDHLRARGGSAPVAALIRALDPLGIRAPAVRTAISRMVVQGWMDPVSTPSGPGYALTERARVRLDEAGARIYRTGTDPWDGTWHLRVLAPIGDRPRRERVRTQLRFLGMAPVSESTWASPRPSAEVDRMLAEEQVEVVALSTRDPSPADALLAAFDTPSLGAAYAAWLAEARGLIGPVRAGSRVEDVSAFVVRSELVHSWRKFLFTDPGLPAELLPAAWPGHAAAAFFDEHASRLRPAATRFIKQCLTQGAS